jgi:hypothetical protein
VADLPIDTADNLVGLLDQGGLVLADGNHSGLEGGDVGGLSRRIAQKACGDIALKAPRLDLVLNGWVALQPGDRDEVQVEQGQLGKSWQTRLNTNCCLFRVDPDCQVIERHLQHVAAHFGGVVSVIGECLSICQK